MNFVREYIFVYCATCVLTSRVSGDNEETSYNFTWPTSNSSQNRTIDGKLKGVTNIGLYEDKLKSKIGQTPNRVMKNGDDPGTYRNGTVDVPTEGGSIRQPLNSSVNSLVRASAEDNRRTTATMSDDAPKNKSQANILARKEADRALSTLRPRTIDAYRTNNKTETGNRYFEIGQRKPKPKPLVTVGGANVDKPIPASPALTRDSSLPRKIDYVVPGVITVLALPLLAAAAFVLYTRGREFWDKRHYRRMDFLIDGMYNE